MDFPEKMKLWFSNNKKIILTGGTVILSLIGSCVGYVLFNNKKVPISDWVKLASTEELNEAYQKLLPNFHKTGTKPYIMQIIDEELGLRGAKEWFEKHPPNPGFRWTDINRWDKD